jgi:hypothetical protein
LIIGIPRETKNWPTESTIQLLPKLVNFRSTSLIFGNTWKLVACMEVVVKKQANISFDAQMAAPEFLDPMVFSSVALKVALGAANTL